MKFVYQYRTPDNRQHRGVIRAASKEAAYSALKAGGIKPGRVEEAPGLFNKLFGKGKRWIAIVLLASLVVALAVALRQSVRSPGELSLVEAQTRRQIIGDTAIIELGVHTGWAHVFDDEGERFLASFAIPGVPAGLRKTTVDEIRNALNRAVLAEDSDSIEARQIKSMVEGMKGELRAFLKSGGTIGEYGKRLVARQDEEIGYYNRAVAEIEAAKKSGLPDEEVLNLWTDRNMKLRRLGVKLIPMPEISL